MNTYEDYIKGMLKGCTKKTSSLFPLLRFAREMSVLYVHLAAGFLPMEFEDVTIPFFKESAFNGSGKPKTPSAENIMELLVDKNHFALRNMALSAEMMDFFAWLCHEPYLDTKDREPATILEKFNEYAASKIKKVKEEE